MKDDFKPPTFDGYTDDDIDDDVVPLENINGWWTTTSGSPTWVPRSLREMVAIDPSAGVVYFYHVETKTWIEGGGSSSGQPVVIVGGQKLEGLSSLSPVTLYTNTSGAAEAIRLHFIVRTNTPDAAAGQLEVEFSWTDDRGEAQAFTSRDVDLTSAASAVNRAATTSDVDSFFIVLPNGEEITADPAMSTGVLGSATFDILTVVERLVDAY